MVIYCINLSQQKFNWVQLSFNFFIFTKKQDEISMTNIKSTT